jgi:hypothetical protein
MPESRLSASSVAVAENPVFHERAYDRGSLLSLGSRTSGPTAAPCVLTTEQRTKTVQSSRGDVDLYPVEVSVCHPDVCGGKLLKHARAAVWLWRRELPDLNGVIT